MNQKQIARGLGWFSIGLGLAEALAPRQLSRLIGLKPSEETDNWLRGFGLREIVAGVGLLTAPHRAESLSKWMWARVAGDALDLAALGRAEAESSGWFGGDRNEALNAARASVAAVTALDLFCALRLSQETGEEASRPYEQMLTLPNPTRGATQDASDAAIDYTRGSVYFVGTATVILRFGGFTILTDPNFLHAGDHVHLGYGLTSERLTEPAINVGQLPPIDFVLLSHYHGDHFDRIAETQLDKRLPIVTTHHAAAALREKGFGSARGLDKWQPITIRKGDAELRITSMPGIHGPGPLQYVLPPVMGSMLEFNTTTGATPLRLYITGDTLIHDDLKHIPERFPNIDLALLHLGGTRVLGVMVTMDAKQGVEMIKITNPKKAVPIHYNDYTVFKSPLEDFKRAVEEAGLSDRLVYLNHGETYDFEVPAVYQHRPQPQRAVEP